MPYPPANGGDSKLRITQPWIDVADRMPEDEQEVIIWHVLGDSSRSPHTMDFAHWIKGKWIMPWGAGAPQWVKAWRPMPDAPRWETPQE